MKAFHTYSKEKQQPFTIYGRLFFANLLSCFKKYLRIKDESRQAVREQAGFAGLCWFGLRGQAALEYFILTFLIIGIVFVALGETGILHWGRQGGKLLFCKALREIFGEVPCDCSSCGPADSCSTTGQAFTTCTENGQYAYMVNYCNQYVNNAAGPIWNCEPCWLGGLAACSWGYSQYHCTYNYYHCIGGYGVADPSCCYDYNSQSTCSSSNVMSSCGCPADQRTYYYNQCMCKECNPAECGPHESPNQGPSPHCPCETRGECYARERAKCIAECEAKCEECL